MEGKMPAPKGNQNALGNKGGRPTKYKAEYAETAQKLCARLGFTDEQLADWFDVTVSTIHLWRLKHVEFSEACRAGKAETDDLVERSTVQHINGYYVEVEELDRHGQKQTLRKWIPGNAHAGMKWLAARRPSVYREQKEHKHSLNMDDAFLRFLDQMDEQAKLDRAERVKLIEHRPNDRPIDLAADNISAAPMLIDELDQALNKDETV
jgi:hypothetical protein